MKKPMTLFLILVSLLFASSCSFQEQPSSQSESSQSSSEIDTSLSTSSSSLSINPENTESLNELKTRMTATDSKELVDYGYDDENLFFIHKIGTISNAIVGFLSPSVDFDGLGEATVNYQQGYATTSSQETSIAITRSVVVEVGGEIGVSAGAVAIMNFSVSLGVELEHTIGYTLSTTLESLSGVSYTLSPQRGPGRYAIIGLANYIVYQTTIYNLSNKNVSSTEIYFRTSPDNPNIGTSLVKTDLHGTFESIVENVTPVITINTLSQEDIDTALQYARDTVVTTFETKYGTKFDIGALPVNVNNWCAYKTVDSVSTIIDEASIPTGILPLYGFAYTKINIELGITAINIEDLQLKLVNRTTQAQVGEVTIDPDDYDWRHVFWYTFSVTVDASFFSSSQVIDFECRAKKVNIFASTLKFEMDRQYEFEYSI